MANSDPQLLFSHTYLSFFAHLLAQRPEGFLLNVRYFYTSGPSGLASGRCKQTKGCLELTSNSRNWFLDRAREAVLELQVCAATHLEIGNIL